MEPELQDYWNFRDDLCICDGLLMKGDRLITPYSLRDEMLEKIQGSLLGLEKCLSRVRECLFWPNIRKNIKEKVASCGNVLITGTIQSRSPCYLIQFLMDRGMC